MSVLLAASKLVWMGCCSSYFRTLLHHKYFKVRKVFKYNYKLQRYEFKGWGSDHFLIMLKIQAHYCQIWKCYYFKVRSLHLSCKDVVKTPTSTTTKPNFNLVMWWHRNLFVKKIWRKKQQQHHNNQKNNNNVQIKQPKSSWVVTSS